jgi:putative hydroxymethylpyrimidine transporter CytX
VTAILTGRAEPGLTLADPQPRSLGFWDQTALWGNLGMSLLGPIGALYVLAPGMSIAAAFTAIVVGTLIGTAMLSLAAAAGARAGRPAMVLLRGLFGARLSYLPTVLNLVQVLGWAVFELVVISDAAAQASPWHARWPYIVGAGALSTLMALRPLGAVRLLRRYALALVLVAIGYLIVQLARQPLPSLTHGSFGGFWAGTDIAIAVAVSWIPLAADYSRHARTVRSAFAGSLAGYALTQIACYTLGLLAFSTVLRGASGDTQRALFGALLAVPAGAVAFAVLVARELDESFANVYSTAVSIQNVLPRADRRVLAVLIGVVATVGALLLPISAYQNFLYLLGSVFVPMFAVFAVRFFLVDRDWDTSESAPPRPLLLVPWALGAMAYQLVNPGGIVRWAAWWVHLRGWLHLTPPSWLSASLTSFAVAGLATLALSRRGRR